MLLKLEKYWITKWYFIKKKIKDFDKKTWEIIPKTDLIAIEFDKVKEHPDLKLHIKSADALIFKNRNELGFLEFKSNITHHWNMSNKKIWEKIRDSFQLLKNVYTQTSFIIQKNKKWLWKKDLFYLCKKKFIFWHNWIISGDLKIQFNLNVGDLNLVENNLIIDLIDMNTLS